MYCNYKERERQTLVNLLAGIWRQLVQSSPTLLNDAKLIYKTHQERDTQLSLWEIEKILQAEVQRLSRVFVVVDALDEASDSENSALLRSLRKLASKANFLFTSRPLDTIKANIGECPRIEVKAVSGDVAKYVRGRIAVEGRLSRYVAKDPALGDMIVSRVSLNARKM